MMSWLRTILVWVVCSLWVAEGIAQELTPRSYWPAPGLELPSTHSYGYGFQSNPAWPKG